MNDPTTTAATTSPVTGQPATLVTKGLNDVYGYDSFGNMTRYNGWTPAYNVNNQIAGWPYDAAGNQLSNGLAQMVWDAESRISAVTGASYLYDAQGNRVESSGSSVTDTVYFNGRPMARLVNGQWTDLIYGPTGLLAEVAGQENAEPQYRLLDHLGTQVGTTDSSQLLKNPLDYNPFGQIRSGNTNDPYFFTGKERDQESGLDYFGARYYASNMGRFMSPDWDSSPVAIPYADRTNPQSFNLYSYVGNNPLSRTDPDGHCTNGGAQKGFFWCLFNDSDQDAAQARQNLAQYKNISINGKTPADAAKGLSNSQTVQLDRSVFNYISSQVMSSPRMMIALALVPGAAEDLIPAEAAAAADSGSLLNLNKSLASQEQMGKLAAGQGEAIAGAGTGTTLRDSQRLASQYGGDPADWQKVASKNYNPGGAKGGGFETHAYQNVKTGQVVEMKTKFQ